MRNNKLHTPTGTKDLLEEECRFKSEIIGKIMKVFSSHGYSPIESPMLEYTEVFAGENRGGIREDQMLRLIDKDGRALALRPDITPAIARIAATAYSSEKAPLRFSYTGNVFRYSGEHQGKDREFPQGGVELMNAPGVYGDFEVLSVAVESLISAGLTEFKIHVGQVDVFKGLMEETGLSPEDKKSLEHFIGKGDYVAVESFIKEKGIPSGIKEIILGLPRLVGGREALASLGGRLKNPKIEKGLGELSELYRLLTLYGIEKYFYFDLGMIGHLNYYTGILFRGFAFGTGYSIVDGGRYDNLVAEYGDNKPAVGFSLRIDGILSALEAMGLSPSPKSVQILLCYEEGGEEKAFLAGKKLREKGFDVVNAFRLSDRAAMMKYGAAAGAEYSICFCPAGSCRLINVKTGAEKALPDMDGIMRELKEGTL